MEIEILNERENQLFKRNEVTVQINHAKEATPTRDAFRKRLAALKNADVNTVVVRNIESTFGMPSSTALVHIYQTPDLAKETEALYILKRNNLLETEEAKE